MQKARFLDTSLGEALQAYSRLCFTTCDRDAQPGVFYPWFPSGRTKSESRRRCDRSHTAATVSGCDQTDQAFAHMLLCTREISPLVKLWGHRECMANSK